MSNCNCHKETFRDGSGQLTRYLQALDPSYAPIDNRSLKDLLVFIQKYATRIRFYDIPESKIDDGITADKISWEDFFKKDLAVIASSVGTTDIADIQAKYNTSRATFESAPDADKLSELFGASVSIAILIDSWHTLSIPSNPLYMDLELAIHSVLSDELRRIISYDEGYKLLNPSKPLNLNYGNLDNNQLWGTDKPIAADSSIFEGNSAEDKLLNAALYADEIFNSFFNVLKSITDNSEHYLQLALSEYPNHQPQMALFIAFLQLFQLTGKELNGLTQRMLDFYYKDILQLKGKDPIPDKVHVVFELAKNIAEYDLAQNTQLKAGKDDSGVEQIYETEEDLVINRATIKELKTIFIEKEIVNEASVIQSIYANPVANSADGNGKPFSTEVNTRWETFGRIPEPNVIQDRVCRIIGQLNKDEAVRNYAMPGFAVASPQLVLGGGNRMVMLASDGIGGLATQFDLQKNENPLTIWLTGEKGWIQITKKITDDELKDISDSTLNALSKLSEPVYSYKYIDKLKIGLIYVLLPISTDAVIPFDEKLHTGYHYDTTQPVMQVMLNPEFKLTETLYNSLSISSFSIFVQVGTINSGTSKNAELDGLKKLILQNDDQIVPEGKAINPYTFFPGTGKSFYIGSEEVFNKPLTQLSINIRSTIENLSRTVNLFLLKDKQWISLFVTENNKVFSYYDLTKNVLENYLKVNNTAILDRHPINSFTELDSSTMKGFVRLDNLYVSAAGGEIPVTLSPQELVPSLEMKEVSLNYSAQLLKLEDGIDQFFHVYPFGVAEIKLKLKDPIIAKPNTTSPSGATAATPSAAIPKATLDYKVLRMFSGLHSATESKSIEAANRLLPQFTFSSFYNTHADDDNNSMAPISKPDVAGISKQLSSIPQIYLKRIPNNQYSGNIEEEGLLYIGLSDLTPLQSVSILFQFAEGSAEDEDNDPPAIHWSYLSKNQWLPLPGENLITDGTYGFQTTGIIKFSIPKDATNDNTIITPGLYWLQASVTENAERIPMLISVVTQAVEAVFLNNNNSDNHFGQALPAGSITKLKDPAPLVSKVIQPFASFDGKRKESGKEFYTRVSERLRHKHRAITPWDYEHLILDRFPSVYKVKCITHTDPNCLCRKKQLPNNTTECCGPQIAPGNILLIPISNLKNRNGVDPLQPKTARRVLIDMVNYLKPISSPFVKIYAKNPVYEQILVSFKVKFYTGTDIGFYLKRLNDEIVRYLTPWAFEESAEVIFGQKIYASSIINFIEERSYVDFITDFEMLVCRKPCCPPETGQDNHDDRPPEEVIGSFTDCNDVESFLNANVENVGEIVACPSTSRSILVSAPRHIITPYEAPKELSPCEQRKLASGQSNEPKDAAGVTPPPVSPLTPGTTIASPAGKKTDPKAGNPTTKNKSDVVIAADSQKTSAEKTSVKETKKVKKKSVSPKITEVKKKKTDKPG